MPEYQWQANYRMPYRSFNTKNARCLRRLEVLPETRTQHFSLRQGLQSKSRLGRLWAKMHLQERIGLTSWSRHLKSPPKSTYSSKLLMIKLRKPIKAQMCFSITQNWLMRGREWCLKPTKFWGFIRQWAGNKSYLAIKKSSVQSCKNSTWEQLNPGLPLSIIKNRAQLHKCLNEPLLMDPVKRETPSKSWLLRRERNCPLCLWAQLPVVLHCSNRKAAKAKRANPGCITLGPQGTPNRKR